MVVGWRTRAGSSTSGRSISWYGICDSAFAMRFSRARFLSTACSAHLGASAMCVRSSIASSLRWDVAAGTPQQPELLVRPGYSDVVFDAVRHYSSVLMQQARSQTDSDFDEVTKIDRPAPARVIGQRRLSRAANWDSRPLAVRQN